jgi:hypothetical protein
LTALFFCAIPASQRAALSVPALFFYTKGKSILMRCKRFGPEWWDQFWRKHRGHRNRRYNFLPFLEIDDMSGSITFTLGDTNTHTATLTCTNTDGTPATGVTVTYSSDAPLCCSVDPNSGVLTLVSAGTANITGTGTRGNYTHADSTAVTIVANDQTGDFTVVLNVA